MTEQRTISDIRGTSLKRELTELAEEMGARDPEVVISCRECDETFESRTSDISVDIFVMRHISDEGHVGFDVGLDIEDPVADIDVEIEIET